jgi:Flp pilus assembly protein TadG
MISRNLISRFTDDESGMALIFVSIMLPVLIGFSLLAIDMSRVNNLHNDLQKAADAFALAGAAELDGGADAITRATLAITNLIDNQSRFSTAGTHTLAIDDVTVTFLDTLPPTDDITLTDAGLGGDGVDYATTVQEDARYAEVSVTPTGFSSIFPASFLGGNNSFNVGAQAVAGFGSAVCDYTPMFICNPWASLEEMRTALSGTEKPMVLLKKHSGGNQAFYGPGNFGFLTTPDDSRRLQDIAEMLAVISPRACYADDGVSTKPGNMPPLNDAINVRFDLFGNGNVSGYTLNPAINPPAPNVRKGMIVKTQGQNCTYDTPPTAQAGQYMGLPKDNCFSAGNCASLNGLSNRLGDGAWDFATYWQVNHPTSDPGPVLADDECGASPSHFCVYRYEIDHQDTLSSGPEATAPACRTTTQDFARRLLHVAVIDCAENPVSGGGGTYPVQVFASLFLTEPAGGAPDADIYAEFVDISGNYGQGTLEKFQRDEAQLYR